MTHTTYQISVNRRIVNKNDLNDTLAFAEGWQPATLSASEIADTINNGCAISAQFEGGLRKAANFQRAQFLAADFDGDVPLEEALRLPLVEKYASIFHTTASHGLEGKDRFRIIFLMDVTIADPENWRAAQKGLAKALNSDPSATDPARLFFGSLGSNPRLFNRTISAEAVEELIAAGRSPKPDSDNRPENDDAIYLPTVRQSSRTIPAETLIKLATGALAKFSEIPKDTRVHCPFHEDTRASAKTLRNRKGTAPGIWCSTCQETFWLEGTRSKPYDFYAFERNVKALATQTRLRKKAASRSRPRSWCRSGLSG